VEAGKFGQLRCVAQGGNAGCGRSASKATYRFLRLPPPLVVFLVDLPDFLLGVLAILTDGLVVI
jgi:hypothetical protein